MPIEPAGAGDFHHLVEHDGRLFAAGMAAGLEADGVDGGVDLVRAGDLGDHFAEPVMLGQVDRPRSPSCWHGPGGPC